MKAFGMFGTDENGNLLLTANRGAITDEELLVEKIVKYLLTIPGSNIVDPSYGSLLGDKAHLSVLGSDLDSVKLLVINAVDSANSYFKGHKYFDRMEFSQIVVSETDPTVFFAEIFVYLKDGSMIIITA